MKPMVRMHNLRLNGDLKLPLPMNHMSEWKVFMPRGWKGHTRKYSDSDLGTVTVNLTPKGAILYFSIVEANTSDEAETKLVKAVAWIIEELAREGIFITNLHQKKEGSYAKVYDPIARYYFNHKITYDGSTFSIDHSHGHPEIEYHSKKGIENYEKLLGHVESGKIDPDVLAEMQESFSSSKNKNTT